MRSASGVGAGAAAGAAAGAPRRAKLRRRALAHTQMLERLMARAARSGCIFQPKRGVKTPAARGMSRTL